MSVPGITEKYRVVVEHGSTWEGVPCDVVLAEMPERGKPSPEEVAKLLSAAVKNYPGHRCVVERVVVCVEVLGTGFAEKGKP